MPDGSKKRSDAEHGQAEPDSVFDFLYYDSQRVGSFLAQFDPNGLLQSLKQAASVGEGRGAKHTLRGGASLGVADLRGVAEQTENQDTREGAERTFDPLWTNARAFLDLLAQRELVQRDVTTARMGQFVLARGRLTVLDNTLLAGAWKLDTIKEAMLSGAEEDAELTGNRQQRRAASKGGKPKKEASPIEMALELLTILPHAVQARITGDETVWCSLKLDGLVTSPSDLILKHGVEIPGEWAMLGILDAMPDPLDQSDPDPNDMTHGIAAMLITLLAPPTRTLLGRPGYAYGMTPLLIFREVAG